MRWLLVCLVGACSGSHSTTTVDASSVVIGVDAPIAVGPVDPMCPQLGAPGDVTVQLPATADSLSVIVSDNTGATLTRTDGVDPGTATIVSVPACGMVSVFRSVAGTPDVVTWTGVQPGDSLVDPRVAMVQVTVNISAQNSGATDYNEFVSCAGGVTQQESGGNPSEISTSLPVCPTNDNEVAASLLVGDAPLTYAIATASIVNGSAALVFGAPAAAPATVHVDLTSFTAYDNVGISTHQVPGIGLDVPYAVDPLDLDANGSAGGDADAGSGAGTIVVAATSGFNQYRTSERVDAFDALPTSIALDSSELLPQIAYTSYSNAGRQSLAISAQTPTDASIMVANFTFVLSSTSLRWMIVAPADTPMVYLPALPTNLVPVFTAATYPSDVTIYDMPLLPTYLLARAHLDQIPASTPTTSMRFTRVVTDDVLQD